MVDLSERWFYGPLSGADPSRDWGRPLRGVGLPRGAHNSATTGRWSFAACDSPPLRCLYARTGDVAGGLAFRAHVPFSSRLEQPPVIVSEVEQLPVGS
jgi:hypothetical protein